MKTLLLFFMLSLYCSVVNAQNQKIIFIVNETNPTVRLTKSQVREIFLKNVREWANGTPVRFFDRVDTPERKEFLSSYIHRTSRQIEQYWIGQKLYTGDAAPVQLNSNNMVVSLVSKFPGGIGYVSGDFIGAKGVRVIEVLD